MAKKTGSRKKPTPKEKRKTSADRAKDTQEVEAASFELVPLGQGTGYAKVGILGFASGGKTWTAALIALGIRKHFGLKGPIAMYDTESGCDYIAPLIREHGAGELIGTRSRSFDDLMSTARACVAQGVSVLIADSMTHVWREVLAAFKLRRNEARARVQKDPLDFISFEDWAVIKPKWYEWTDFYLTSPLHIVICGRAGYEWDHEENEDGKRELVKTGIKMKTEGELAFEPSLLIEMQRVQEKDRNDRLTGKFVHQATILKDRFGKIDGAVGDDPDYEFFKPHMDMLTPGAHAPVDTRAKTRFALDESGRSVRRAEAKERTILMEEVQGLLVSHFPGQAAAEKKAKADLLEEHFGTRSWTAIEQRTPAEVRRGLHSLREKLEEGA